MPIKTNVDNSRPKAKKGISFKPGRKSKSDHCGVDEKRGVDEKLPKHLEKAAKPRHIVQKLNVHSLNVRPFHETGRKNPVCLRVVCSGGIRRKAGDMSLQNRPIPESGNGSSTGKGKGVPYGKSFEHEFSRE